MNKSPVTASNIRVRRSFAKTKHLIDIPNLIELQKKSYEAFLQRDVDPDRRGDVGLQGVFKSVFPISDFNNTASLEFVSYTLEPAKYDVDECRQRGMTFAAPIKVTTIQPCPASYASHTLRLQPSLPSRSKKPARSCRLALRRCCSRAASCTQSMVVKSSYRLISSSSSATAWSA